MEIIKRMLQKTWLIPAFLIFVVSIIYFFGSYVPYINVLQTHILKVLVFFLILSSVFLSLPLRRLFSIVFLAYVLFTSDNLFWSLVLFILIVPPFNFYLLKTSAVYIWKYLQKVPFYPAVFVLLVALILSAYWPMKNSYFEGDEWIFFRLFTPLLQSKWWFMQGFLTTFDTANTILIHKTPFANMLYVQEFKLFGLNFLPYLVVSLVSHLLVSCSLLLFFVEFTKNKFLSVLATVLFAISAVHSQGVTWIMAAVHTEYAVGFGFLSLYFALKSFHTEKNWFTVASAVALLLALWGKETAIIFIPLLFFLYWQSGQLRRLNLFKNISLYIVILLFLVTQFSARISEQSKIAASEPWLYSVIAKYESYNPQKLFFWTGTLLLKAPAQSLIPHQTILTIGYWLTDEQFPYFTQEKRVGGPKYTSFVFAPMPEMISYVLSCVVVFFILAFVPDRHKKIKHFLLFYFLVSITPLIANIIQFPWWGYTALIDSRHLYHISPSIIMLSVLALEGLIEKLKNISLHKNFILIAITLFVGYYYSQSVHEIIKRQQKDANFSDRKMIVSTLLNKVSPPPKDLIIYTKSNRTYYGFANYMLPFQTAFSHMMPVIFSSEYHPSGLSYPQSFYTENYFAGQENGIITEGYYEEGEYALGYYLSKIPLIKLIERHKKSLDSLYSFTFDGDAHTFIDSTNELRKEIQELLDRRKVFSSWKRYGSIEEGFSFQADPTWRVTNDSEKNEYSVFSSTGQLILRFVAIDNSDEKDFATYVINQYLKVHPPEEAKYIMSHVDLDLDYPHNIYYHKTNPNEFYILSGNNEMFYKVTVIDKEKTALLLRTVEFNDTIDEDISL